MPDQSTLLAVPASLESINEIAELEIEGSPHAITLNLADGTPAPTSLRTFARAYWSTDALSVIFSGMIAKHEWKTDAGHAFSALRTPGLWDKSEVCELFIGPWARQNLRYKEFEVSPDGRWICLDVRKEGSRVVGDQSWRSDFRCEAILSSTLSRWRVMMRVPWQDLGAQDPDSVEWHCNLCRAAPAQMGGHLLSWMPTGYGPQCFHRPERFGRLLLVDR
jgi:hypothetical protein